MSRADQRGSGGSSPRARPAKRRPRRSGSSSSPSARGLPTSPTRASTPRSGPATSPRPSAGSSPSGSRTEPRTTSSPSSRPRSRPGCSSSRPASTRRGASSTEYFDRDGARFELELDWSLVPRGFYGRVLRATAKLPFGATATYGEMAGRAGNPRAFRAAGTALGSNPIPIVVPCHRVVRAGGELGDYGGGAADEGVPAAARGRVRD